MVGPFFLCLLLFPTQLIEKYDPMLEKGRKTVDQLDDNTVSIRDLDNALGYPMAARSRRETLPQMLGLAADRRLSRVRSF